MKLSKASRYSNTCSNCIFASQIANTYKNGCIHSSKTGLILEEISKKNKTPNNCNFFQCKNTVIRTNKRMYLPVGYMLKKNSSKVFLYKKTLDEFFYIQQNHVIFVPQNDLDVVSKEQNLKIVLNLNL